MSLGMKKTIEPVNIPWLKKYDFFRKKEINPFSLISAIIFLTKDINEEEEIKEKSKLLLEEIRKILQKRSKNRDKEILVTLKNNFDFVNINDNINKSYFTVNNKNYSLLSNKVKQNYSSNAYLFNYYDLIEEYIFNRKNSKIFINETQDFVEKIKENIDKENNCYKAKISIEEKDKFKNNLFIENILGNLNIDFYIPLSFISKILRLNFIILNINKEDVNVSEVVINNKKDSFLILNKYKNLYQPVFIKDQKLFQKDDKIIYKLVKYYKKENIEYDEKEGVKNYVKQLNLEEA
jgi:hypothetical protein